MRLGDWASYFGLLNASTAVNITLKQAAACVATAGRASLPYALLIIAGVAAET